jgi:hypothetical protein
VSFLIGLSQGTLLPVVISYTIGLKVSIQNLYKFYTVTLHFYQKIYYISDSFHPRNTLGTANRSGIRIPNLPGVPCRESASRWERPSDSPQQVLQTVGLAKLTSRTGPEKQYFYTEKENLLFTFTSVCDIMYEVKIGNYFRIYQKFHWIFLEIPA